MQVLTISEVKSKKRNKGGATNTKIVDAMRACIANGGGAVEVTGVGPQTVWNAAGFARCWEPNWDFGVIKNGNKLYVAAERVNGTH